MSELVVMPKSHWQAALDKVRELAHTQGPIKSGELAAIIDGISLLEDHFTALASGTITRADSTTSTFKIEHGLGVTPNFFFVFADEPRYTGESANQSVNYVIAAYMHGGTAICGVYGMGTGYSDISAQSFYYLQKDGTGSQGTEYKYISDFFDVNVIKPGIAGTKYFHTGRTFHWICGATKHSN